MGKDKSSEMPAAVTASELDEFRTLIEQRSAICFDASRERFFAPRVNQYLRECGEQDAAGLLLRIRGSNVEYDRFLESLLTQETSFFVYRPSFKPSNAWSCPKSKLANCGANRAPCGFGAQAARPAKNPTPSPSR